ncbi:MAG: hypothetical protein AAF415_17580 [Pseudomonadota bacterium]
MAFDLRATALIIGDVDAARPDLVVERARARFPGLGEVSLLAVDATDCTSIAHSLAGQHDRYAWMGHRDRIEGSSALVHVDDEPFVLIYTPFAFPHDPAKQKLKPLCRFDPAPALAAQNAHITIAPVRPRKGELIWTRAQATVLQAFAAAIADLVETPALYWRSAQAFQPKERIQSAAERALREEIPVTEWVQFYHYAPQNPALNGQEALWGMMTLGLTPFIGREVELAAAPVPMPEAMEHAFGATCLLFERGATFQDRETLSNEDGRAALLRDLPGGWLRQGEGLGAYVLVRSDSVIDPETLRVATAPSGARSLWNKVVRRA